MNSLNKFNIYKQLSVDENIVYLSGDLDLSVATELMAELEPLINKSEATLILNLNGLRYIDSTGIGIFVSVLKAREAMKGSFYVNEIPVKIKRIFDITGITAYLLSSPAKERFERTEDII